MVPLSNQLDGIVLHMIPMEHTWTVMTKPYILLTSWKILKKLRKYCHKTETTIEDFTAAGMIP